MENPDPFHVITELDGKQIRLPAGYKFNPEHKEILVHYLKNRILDKSVPVDIIPTIDLYSFSAPDKLPLCQFDYVLPNVYYYFTNALEKNPILTSDGSWNQISREEIFEQQEVIGSMRMLAFSYADPPPESEWFIHEYRVHPGIFAADELNGALREKISKLAFCRVCWGKDPNETSSNSGGNVEYISSEYSSASDEQQATNTSASDCQEGNEVFSSITTPTRQ